MAKLLGEFFGVIARKDHECWWCGEVIERGEEYDYWVIRDGRIETIRCHLECRSAWDEMSESLGFVYEVWPGYHSRGCCCERGKCECEWEVDQ